MDLTQDHYEIKHWLECQGMNIQGGGNSVKMNKGSKHSAANLEVPCNSDQKDQKRHNSSCW